MNTLDSSSDFAAQTPLKNSFAIQVIGVGGAGGNAVSHLAQREMPGVRLTLLNTDSAALAASSVPAKRVLGAQSSRGLGAGGDPERGRRAAEEDWEDIRSLCQGADIVFIVAGLGGGTGTGASPVVARAAKEAGALVLAVVMTPFDCEGPRRQRQAQAGLEHLKQACDGVICLPNQKVFKLIDEKTSLVAAFALINDLIAQGVSGIGRLLSHPGLINVDFSDLCAVTQGKHAESMLVNVEARGDHRVKELTERLLAHPLLEGGQALAQAGAILVCIAGGPDLSMGEVERIMEQIQRHADQAQIIMGTSIDPEWADGLSLMLVASSGAEASRAATASAVPAPPATSTPRGESDTRTGREPTAEGEAARREQTQDWVEEPAEGRRPTVAEPGANLPECDEAALQDPWNQPSEPRERRTSPFAAPPPELSQEAAEQLFRKLGGRSPFRGSNANRMRQAQLPLEIISKGRFEKSEPTLYRGEDLDVPTYIRRGVPLN